MRMGKMKNLIEKWTTGLKGWLRNRLDALPPKARLRIVLAAFAVFASLCLYMTAAAIIGFGKGGRGIGDTAHREVRNI